MITKALDTVRNYHIKARRIDNGEEVIGYLWHGASKALVIPENFGIGYDEEEKRVAAHAHEVDKDTLCRYTGVENYTKSKAGWVIEPVWEGDVIEHKTYNGFICISEVKTGEYQQDGSGGEYNRLKCCGVYAEVIDFVCTGDMEPSDFQEYQKQENIMQIDEACQILGNVKFGFDKDKWKEKFA